MYVQGLGGGGGDADARSDTCIQKKQACRIWSFCSCVCILNMLQMCDGEEEGFAMQIYQAVDCYV